MRHEDLSRVKEVLIGNQTLSDHSPISLTLEWGENTPRRTFWRLNEGLIQNSEIRAKVSEELEFFFKTNNTPDVGPMVLWEAHKAYMRGILIKIGSQCKKVRNRELEEILKQIGELEVRHKGKPSEVVGGKLRALREKMSV